MSMPEETPEKTAGGNPSLALDDTGEAAAYWRSWLALQASMISSAVRAIMVLGEPDSESYLPAAMWPDNDAEPERLAEISERVLSERCGLVSTLPGPGESGKHSYAIAYPLIIDGSLQGAIAMEIAPDNEHGLQPAMEQLQWGAGLVELFFRRRSLKEIREVHERLQSAVDLLAAVLAEESFESACMAFTTAIAARMKCDRVSLGFMKGDKTAVQAISHSASFDKRMKFVRSVGLAMDEAITQARDIVYPPDSEDDPAITRCHRQIIDQYGAESIMTIPIYGKGKYFGAVTLERQAFEPFGQEETETCRSIFALAAPVLEGKRLQSSSLARQAVESMKSEAKKLLGPRHTGHKLSAILALVAVVFFGFAKGEYRITANSTLEGAVRRTIGAPFKGYIKEARARAGDTVTEGKVICSLDERDLQLERTNLIGQQNQLLKQHQESMALHDKAKLNIINAQLEQIIAQLNLTEIKLQRINIKAPFDGILVSGDLSQKLGAAVDQGEPLFEIAPLTGYRLILQVSEGDIADVQKGQKGVLSLPALSDKFGFTVEKITPMTAAQEGKNTFRVEAKLESISEKLRPGMEGVGKISIDERKLISIWTRKLRDWLRLWIWTWWP